MAEARFRMPDGRTGTLRGDSMPALYRKAEEMGAQLIDAQAAAGTTPLAVANAVGARAVGGMANTAERVVNAPGKALNPLLSALFPSGEIRTTAGLPGIPARLPQFSMPTGQQLTAAMESPMQAVLAGQSMGEAYETRFQDRQQIAQDRPGATVAGNLLADTASLYGLRAPMRGGNPGGAFDKLSARGMQAVSEALSSPTRQRGFRAMLSAAAKSDAGKKFGRGLGRVSESGLEGAILGVMQDGDPAEMAMFGAGAQAAGSLSNTVLDSMIGGPGFGPKGRSIKRAGLSALLGATMFSLISEAPPMDEDRFGEFISDLDTNFEKIASLAAIGFVTGLVGRRGSDNARTLGTWLPGAADFLSTLPRAGILELARESGNDRMLAQAMQNAPMLGESDAKRFMDILESDMPAENMRSWISGNERVRRILAAPDPRLANVPEMEN